MLQGKELVKNLFKQYYRWNALKIQIPDQFDKREFGFILFDKEEQMFRHISFKRKEDIFHFFKEKYPKHAYFSTAYYANPEIPVMGEKGWLGANLVFDIDIDHIPTSCKNMHDRWFCLNCGFKGNGMIPVKCPKCGSERIKKETWVCEKCIEIAKNYTLKLIDLLIDIFGFSLNEMKIVFSGHRGFHVHIISNDIMKLDQRGRREIVNFVKGEGLIQYILDRIKAQGVFNLSVDMNGWYSKLARTLYELFLTQNIDFLKKEIGISKKSLEFLKNNKEKMLRNFERTLTWRLPLSFNEEDLKRILNYAISKNNIPIDERVTIDIRRLIRVINSLHGKTGFRVIQMSYQDLELFSLKKAIVFNKPEYIKLHWENPPLYLLDYKLNVSNKIHTLPFYIGIYVIENHVFNVEILDIV